jgi:hypothetical protein
MAWKRVQSLTEHLVLLRQGDLLFHGGTEPKELANLIKRSTKT